MVEQVREYHVSCEPPLTLSINFRKIFPNTSPESVLIPVEGSPLDRIRQKRVEEAQRARGGAESSGTSNNA